MFLTDFSKLKTVHFIGIGGIGTSAIARMFLLDGNPSTGSGRVRVSGSDMAESEVTKALREAGAVVYVGDAGNGIPVNCDLVVYTIAIPEDHHELVEAKKRGIPVISYPEVLGIISKEKYTIAITGTHGKTTTTAMVAKILMDVGLDPTVIIGSFLFLSPPILSKEGHGVVATPSQSSTWKVGEGKRTNFVAGKSQYLIVEGCEYRRSFLNLLPKILVILNIDADHLDYYKDLNDIKSAFAELVAKLPKDGVLIDKFTDISLPEDFKLKIPGRHNLENAKAALAVARALKIDEVIVLKSLAEFSGTWRRFEYRGKAANGAVVYDDYGHHPREIEATLQGARELFPTQKIAVVFQPHLYSRTKDHLAGFGKCFKLADEVILLPIYPAREPDPGDINSQMVAAEIKKNGQSANFVKTFAESAAFAQELSSAGDLILTLGAGETNRVADILVKR